MAITPDLSTLAVSPGPQWSNDHVMFVSRSDFRRLSTMAGVRKTFTVDWLSAACGEGKTLFIAAGDPETDPELLDLTRKLPRPPVAAEPKVMTAH